MTPVVAGECQGQPRARVEPDRRQVENQGAIQLQRPVVGARFDRDGMKRIVPVRNRVDHEMAHKGEPRNQDRMRRKQAGDGAANIVWVVSIMAFRIGR